VIKITSSLSLSATFCALFCNTVTCFCVFTCIIYLFDFYFIFDAKKSSLIAKKVGDDLEVALEEGVIIFDNYFAFCALFCNTVTCFCVFTCIIYLLNQGFMVV
jgi:hypothetical protein